MLLRKILVCFAFASLSIPVAGDVVEYACCETTALCNTVLRGDAGGGLPPGCKYFYADPFPDTVTEIRDLCPLNDGGVYPEACIDNTAINDGIIYADVWCCDGVTDCPSQNVVLDTCDGYFFEVNLADIEDACNSFLSIRNADGPVPPASLTCLAIIAAFGGMDPHFQTWGGDWYDFHGVCDLVMLDVPDFGNGKGLTIHARTKDRYDYSYIESAAIKIGDNVFQISSFGDYILDGVSQAELPSTIGGYTIRKTLQNEKESKFEIKISDHKSIELSSFKDMVNVRTPVLNPGEFHTSKGLFGKFPSGELVGRDGTTVFTDHNKFGQEWQVLESEPKLFQDKDRFPQHPHHECVLPDPKKEARRRLGETVAREAADSACSHWGALKDMCIMDVMSTGDIEIAQSDHKMMM